LAISASTVWQRTQCASITRPPLPPSVPLTIGGGSNDWVARSSGTIIGSSTGSFDIAGVTSESGDSKCFSSNGDNCYSLQLNTNVFNGVSTSYTDNKPTTGWEQFIFANAVDALYIQFWLIGYHSTYGGCPGTSPPGSVGGWLTSGNDCYASSASVTPANIAATDLGKATLAGYAKYQGSGDDTVSLCVRGGNCYSQSITDDVLGLSQHWLDSEFNIFGDCCGSQANFNAGTTINVFDAITDQPGNQITPSCVNTSYTGETNNLFLDSCNGTATGLVFSEATMDYSITVTPSLSTALTGGTATYTVTVT
jgi:hypothetical protein